jgi:hypothetical protein
VEKRALNTNLAIEIHTKKETPTQEKISPKLAIRERQKMKNTIQSINELFNRKKAKVSLPENPSAYHSN